MEKIGKKNSFQDHLAQLKSCQVCKAHLHFHPNPVVQLNPEARLLIIGQAPGRKAHETTAPFNDPSGDRLRSWLHLSREEFYNPHKIALMPMGFCYPGRDNKGGDLPPQKACASLWHEKTLTFLPNIRLILLVGHYAQKYYLKEKYRGNLTETVKAWRNVLPLYFPLPHPSWRNTAWLKKNPWFEQELLPDLRKYVKNALEA